MTGPSYRSFSVRHIERDEDTLVEIVDVVGRKMVLATDLKPRADGSFDQEGYGFMNAALMAELPAIVAELRRRVLGRRVG